MFMQFSKLAEVPYISISLYMNTIYMWATKFGSRKLGLEIAVDSRFCGNDIYGTGMTELKVSSPGRRGSRFGRIATINVQCNTAFYGMRSAI